VAAAADPRRAFEAAAGILLDGIDIIALVLDPAGRVVLANRACEDVLGMPADKLLGRTPLELGFGPREACGDEATGDVEVCDTSGRVRLVAWTSRVLFAPDGAVSCVVATGTDVTDARANEQRLRESERRFRELAENVNDLVAELTGDGVFTYVNPRFETVLGFPPEHYLGSSLDRQLHPDDLDDVRRTVAELAEPGVSRQCVMRLARRGGGHCTLESVARAFPARDGTLRLAVIARDLSERTAAEAELRRADRLVTLGTFAAGVAHEINNPLGVILGYTRLLRKKAEGSVAEELSIIEQETLRCQEIVEGLLDLSRPMDAPMQQVDLRRLCDDVVSRLADSRQLGGVEVCVEGEAAVRGQSQKLRQVVFNLIKNAVEAAGRGGRVHVHVGAAPDGVAVAVADSGPGIRETARGRLFEPFFTTKPAGTGLGLAVSRAIARAHGGDIVAGGAPLGGAVFTLRLPARTAEAT